MCVWVGGGGMGKTLLYMHMYLPTDCPQWWTGFFCSLHREPSDVAVCRKDVLWIELHLRLGYNAPNWKFEPSTKAHAHSDPIACIELYATGENSLSHWKALPMDLKKTLNTPTKTSWSRSQFLKGQSTPCNSTYAFPTYLWVRDFWPQIYSLWQALDWGLLFKILGSMKMGGA